MTHSKNAKLDTISSGWQPVDLIDFCTLQRGFDITESTRKPGTIPVYSSSGLAYYHNKSMVAPPGVVTGRKGILGKVFLIDEPFWPHDTTLWVKDFKGNLPAFVALVLSHFRLERLDAATSVPTLNRNNLSGHIVLIPNQPAEQEAIVSVLSDADAYIGSLEKIIAKKRLIKKGVMRELLLNKSKCNSWKLVSLQDIATVSKGTQPAKEIFDRNYDYPFLNGGMSPSGFVSDWNKDANTIAISEGGNSCGYVQLMREKFWCGGHCYSISPQKIDNNFLYHALKVQEANIMGMRVGSGLPNIQKKNLLNFQLKISTSIDEQQYIAGILTDMDLEIRAQEGALAKAQLLKQGMMQELLSGRIRLV